MALIALAVVQQHYGIPTRLAQWRRQGTGPEYFTLGHRSIRYYPADIDDWINHQTQHADQAAGKLMDQVVLPGDNGGSNATVRWNG
ncbi:helix-turn-helix transcriptional regulator [Arthrobacter crystallopoietes]|uniref:Helix-turn-helix domain-containing protein n=1 Tax=Crystallibacter crystallopoietes TaxID=37928 RepID=A0A1H1CVB2_9MICC|nr:hypothetical protein [Arthrobacter crystallopoietes]AUI50587.1 hypothetical protein AC20117_06845 [Arthrobacter crystallopoietes]SDQ68201.1 hypothetical protein SAMN04489742_2113 [Arthrobacter crystallopoietes]